jgi:hypothetical protein
VLLEKGRHGKWGLEKLRGREGEGEGGGGGEGAVGCFPPEGLIGFQSWRPGKRAG